MKIFFAILIFAFEISSIFCTNLFPKADYGDAKDAIELPRYQESLKRLFPHINTKERQRRIIGGTPATFGDFPYQVLQYMTLNNVGW